MSEVNISPQILSNIISNKFIGFVKNEEISTDESIVLEGTVSITKIRVVHEYLLKVGMIPTDPEFNRGFSDYSYFDKDNTVQVIISIKPTFNHSITISKVSEGSNDGQ